MPVKYIAKEFTYPIPDAWISDQFTQGKTGTWTYEGPEFLTFEIDNESGKESGWCLWLDEDLERPIIRGLYTINENNTLIRDLPKRISISKVNDSTYVADNIVFNGDIGFGLDIYDIQYKN